MGLSSSCSIFETFSTSLEWMDAGCLLLHILDDANVT